LVLCVVAPAAVRAASAQHVNMMRTFLALVMRVSTIVDKYPSVLYADRNRCEACAQARSIDANAIIETEHRTVMRAHHEFPSVCPERVRLVVQRNREVRAHVAVRPCVIAAAQYEDRRRCL